jgi:hypothetical protein
MIDSKPMAAERITSVDLIRGLAMILMAIDHVRVYSGLPAGGPTFGIFFTRWITHFCAPAFVFLAGTSAFLYGRAHANLARHLVFRGVWLIFLELTVIRLAWTYERRGWRSSNRCGMQFNRHLEFDDRSPSTAPSASSPRAFRRRGGALSGRGLGVPIRTENERALPSTWPAQATNTSNSPRTLKAAARPGPNRGDRL